MHSPRLATALLLVALLTAAADASAQEEPPAPPPAPARWTVGFNPLAMIIGRLGGDVQRLVAPHHVFVVNVHGDYSSHDLPSIEYDRLAPVWGFGGEVGWRLYPRPDGMHGQFYGASIIGGYYNVDYRGRRLDLPGVGFAVDIGRQWDLGGGLFLAGGFGLQFLWTTRYPADIAPGVSQVMGAGWDPRILVTFGGELR